MEWERECDNSPIGNGEMESFSVIAAYQIAGPLLSIEIDRQNLATLLQVVSK